MNPPEVKVTAKERRRREASYPKCWCGNVAGLGQTLCGKHRATATAPLEARIALLEAAVGEAVGALERIAEPLAALQRDADNQGYNLPRSATEVADSVAYARLIARTTLARLSAMLEGGDT